MAEHASSDKRARESAAGTVLLTKLRPSLTRDYAVPARLARLLQPAPGRLLLIHAPAGYGKTTALATTRDCTGLWYNLDPADREPRMLASRLTAALDLEPIDRDGCPMGEAVATELAARIGGRRLTVTFDRYQHLGDAPEVGRLLGELLILLPALSVRLATRTRPALPLERLRLEGRLVEVGAEDLRLRPEQIEPVLRDALGRPPSPAELDFADSMLRGWPAAIHLWLAGLDGEADLMAPLAPGKPLHDYLHEELLRSTLTPEAMEVLRGGLSWLVGSGPIMDRATTAGRRLAADNFIRHRVGVVHGPGGWRWHPLVGRFLAMHLAPDGGEGGVGAVSTAAPPPAPAAASPAVAPGPEVAIRAFGSLNVSIGGLVVEDAAWPSAARRLLELLLCLPGYQATALQAAHLLWPRYLARSALNSFNVALHSLRRILEPNLRVGAESRYVVRQGKVYRLCMERLWCDVEEFSRLVAHGPVPLDDDAADRLQNAVGLYSGHFLAVSPEKFAGEQRARLQGLVARTLEQLGEWYALGGRRPRAMAAFDRLLELAPQREDVWARLLELHLSAADEYRALAALHRCEQSLRAAGIEPSGLLKELYRRIRREAPPG